MKNTEITLNKIAVGEYEVLENGTIIGFIVKTDNEEWVGMLNRSRYTFPNCRSNYEVLSRINEIKNEKGLF